MGVEVGEWVVVGIGCCKEVEGMRVGYRKEWRVDENSGVKDDLFGEKKKWGCI